MAGAAIAAGIGLTGMAATVAAIAINFAIGFAASYLVAKAAMKNVGGTASAADYKQTVQSDKQAQRVIYGERRLALVLNFAEEQDGVQGISTKTGESHELLYLTGMLCNHPVYEIGDVYLDDKLLSEYGSNVEIGHVNGTGIIPEFLKYKPAQHDEDGNVISPASGAMQYDLSMTGSNGYWLAAKLKHDSTLFSGIPDITVVIKGKKIKDLRTGEMVYSNNLALVMADFYMNYMGVPEERLITSGYGSFIDAANLCDEITETGEKRYTVNGMFSLDQTPSSVLNEMLVSCAGTLVRTNGQIGLLPAAYYGNSTFTITESDIVGGVSMAPQEAMGDAVNIMQGKYVSPADDWNEQDFTPIRDEGRIARDGYEIAEDVTYSYVTNPMQAQRVASIELRRRIAGGFVDLTMNPKGAYCRIGRVVTLDLPSFGIQGEYRVLTQTENPDLTFDISIQKDDIDIYDDAVGEPYDPPPSLDLGEVGVAAPTGLQFTTTYNDNVGNVIQGALTWQNNSASTQYFDVKVEDGNGGEIQAGQVPTTVFNLNALPQGEYKGRVRAVNARGNTSPWTEVTFGIGAPASPAAWYLKGLEPDVGQFTLVELSNWNIEIVPNIDGGTPQGTQFEFWYLADSESHITGTPSYDSTSVGLAELVGVSNSLNKGSMTPDRWAHFWVRSVNSYGKSDFLYIQAWTTKDQSLVTTVVEKLVAVEVESGNWTPDNTGISDFGYKLYSPASDPVTMPDGTVLNNPDGLAVFQNLVANGHITAKSLTFVSDDAIPDSINNDKAVEESKTYVDQNFVDAVTYGTEIADIQAQLDKSITSWFSDGTPTLTNYPANQWATDADKDVHLGDLYYDNDGGKSYRFSHQDGVYVWIRVVDTDVEVALAAAAKAQDTADGKRRVFFATPTAPYDRGDLWDTGNGIRRADVASTTTFQDSHWVWSSDAHGAASAAETAAKSHADAKSSLAQTEAEAYADGIVTAEEQRAIADAQEKADIAEANAKAYADDLPSDMLVYEIDSFYIPDESTPESGAKVFTFTMEEEGSVLFRLVQETVPSVRSINFRFNNEVQPTILEADYVIVLDAAKGENVITLYDTSNEVNPQAQVHLLTVKDITGNSAEQEVTNRIYPDQNQLQISSSNYQQGVEGWAIDAEGVAEFLNLYARGTLESSTFRSGTIIGSTIYAVDTEELADPYWGTPQEGAVTYYSHDNAIPVAVNVPVSTVHDGNPNNDNSGTATLSFVEFELFAAADNDSEFTQERSKYPDIPADTLVGSYNYPSLTFGSTYYGTPFYNMYSRGNGTLRVSFTETVSGNVTFQDVSFNPMADLSTSVVVGGMTFDVVIDSGYYPQSRGSYETGDNTHYYQSKGGYSLAITVKSRAGNFGSVTNDALNGTFKMGLNIPSPYINDDNGSLWTNVNHVNYKMYARVDLANTER